MENNQIEKTLLMVYRYLEPVADKIDALIEREAEASFYTCMQNVVENSCEKVAGRMIDLMEHKKNMINLKVATDHALSKMDDLQYTILSQHFFEGKRIEKIAEEYDMNERTAFRRLNSAIENFKNSLHCEISPQRLYNMLCFEPWIARNFQKEQDEKTMVN